MIPRLLCWSSRNTATTTRNIATSASTNSRSWVHYWWRRLAAMAMAMLSSTTTTTSTYSSILSWGLVPAFPSSTSSARSIGHPVHHATLFAGATPIITNTPDSNNSEDNTVSQNNNNQNTMNSDETCTNNGDNSNNETNPTPSPRIFQHYDDTITVHHFGPDSHIASTQDEARRLLHELHDSTTNNSEEQLPKYLAVMADRQTNGRGTSGRSWEYGAGNLYLTLCVPLGDIPVMPTLLPLQMAVMIAQNVQSTLSSPELLDEDVVHVKWPNDVLLGDQKLAGTLIESELVPSSSSGTTETWLLIGIGVNIEHAPSLQGTPGKHVRSAACLRDYWNDDSKPITAADLGLRISQSLVEWIQSAQSSNRATREAHVVQEWKKLFPFGSVYQLRASDPLDEMKADFQGEQVVAVDLQYDGQLVVQGADGKERLLIADYLF